MGHSSLENGFEAVLNYYQGHSQRMQEHYKRACHTIKGFYDRAGIEEYQPEFNQEIMELLLAGRELKRNSGYLFCRYVFRTLGMLKDYYADRPFQSQYPMFSRYKYDLDEKFLAMADDFSASLTVRPQTQLGLYSIMRDFCYYLNQNSIDEFSRVDQRILYSFMAWEHKTYPATLDRVGYGLRLICKFLNEKGVNNVTTQILPFALPTPRKKIYPAFTHDDMAKILAHPDRSTAAGKRDYAVLYLASTTGMRAVDIAGLELSDINWDEQTICFVQSKTKNATKLPVDVEAISALADYILNGRQDCNDSHVFLSLRPPCRAIGKYGSVGYILSKHMKAAGIQKDTGDGKAFHAFRRSMGAWLLETSSEPEMISQILGHRSRDVLKVYLPLATSKMNVCALGFEGIEIRAGVYK